MSDSTQTRLSPGPGVLLAVFLAVLLVTGPGYGQTPQEFRVAEEQLVEEPEAEGQATENQATEEPEATPQPPPAQLVGPAAAEPVVTRAWAHDDFGRIVFDWPRAVEYEAGLEDNTLSVMFEHQLKTTFWQVQRYLGAYISAVNLSPDGRRVTAALTGDYRLRTFTLSSESGVAKVVVDLLSDGGQTHPGLRPPLPGGEKTPPPSTPTPEGAAEATGPIPSSEGCRDSGGVGCPPASTTQPPPDQQPAARTAQATTPEAEPPQRQTHPGLRPPLPGGEKTPPPSTPTPEGAAEATGPIPSSEGCRDSGGVGCPPAPTAQPTPDQHAAAPTTHAPTSTPQPDPPRPSATPPRRGEDTAPRPAPEAAAASLPPVLSIPVSQSRLFRLDVPVASVFVANPAVADVQLVSSGALFVLGKEVGRTSVVALDADSKLIAEWTIAAVIDVGPVQAALREVPALNNVSVRQLHRGVELSGEVASVAEADLALRLAGTALPEETPVANRLSVSGGQQINLEVQIAEVQRSVSETLGINWEVIPNLAGESVVGFRVGRFFFDETRGFLSEALPGGRAASVFGAGMPGRTTVRGLIDALATAGLATVLARPNVTAISGETASFFSGGEYPLPAGFEDGAIIFEYKKYGVLLDFVPTIVDSGRIVLTVRPEVSQRSETDSLRVTGIDIPVINVRRAETTVEVGDGESIVIAGLYRDQSEAVEVGVPVLKDIPVLNLLFGSRTVRSNATELIVVVTARLTDATAVARPADRQTPGRRLRGYHY